MKVLSVNVSLPREVTVKGKTVRTGIFKEPVPGPAIVETLNIDGDGQADLVGHGGEMRAVLVYSFENYAHWETELGRTDFEFGQFGENFTVDYQPGESKSGLFGGNSNWRGPVWFPINFLLIEALQRFHHFYGDDLRVECPTGSGNMATLAEVVAF